MKTTTKTAVNSQGFSEAIVNMNINTSIDEAFNYLAPINLMHIFRGTALIPGIADTTIKEGWNKAGLSRTIIFKDGSTSQETLLTWDAPKSFSYKNEQFSSKILGSLLKRLEGNWLFTDLGKSTTNIIWTYTAIPTNWFAKIFVKFILIKAISNMLETALTIGATDLETGKLENGQFNKSSK